MLLVASVPGISGLAQEATPSESDSGPGPDSRGNPDIGDEVRFITESGSEVARLRVTDVAIPWEEYGEFYEPDPGTVYIAFVIEITNLGSRGNLIVRGDDFRVQDVDGFSTREHSRMPRAERRSLQPRARSRSVPTRPKRWSLSIRYWKACS